MNKILLSIFASLSLFISYAQNWSSVGSGTDDIVYALYGDEITNRLYVGGAFSSPFDGICFWDGSSFNPMGTGIIGTVRSITKFGNDVIVAGEITSAGGLPVTNVAKWDGSNWSAMGSGISGTGAYVTSLVVYNNELYASGNFSNPSGRVAKWNGSDWVTINANADGVVRELEVFQGNLILAGGFTNIGGFNANRIAKYNGSSFSSLSGDNYDDIINQNCLTANTDQLLVSGLFTTIGSGTYNRAAIWDGSLYSNLSSGLNGGVLCSGLFNNEFIVGGGFTDASGVSVSYISLWNGTNWETMGQGLNDFPYVMTEFNNSLFIGGSFTQVDGTIPANRIAKWSNSSADISEFMDQKFILFPNPTSSIIKLLTDVESFGCELLDVNGNSIMLLENIEEIDMSNLPSGIYILRFTFDERIQHYKIIKD